MGRMCRCGKWENKIRKENSRKTQTTRLFMCVWVFVFVCVCVWCALLAYSTTAASICECIFGTHLCMLFPTLTLSSWPFIFLLYLCRSHIHRRKPLLLYPSHSQPSSVCVCMHFVGKKHLWNAKRENQNRNSFIPIAKPEYAYRNILSQFFSLFFTSLNLIAIGCHKHTSKHILKQ